MSSTLNVEIKMLALTHCPTKKIVSWALRRLTSEFGMGSGRSISLQRPAKYYIKFLDSLKVKRKMFLVTLIDH